MSPVPWRRCSPARAEPAKDLRQARSGTDASLYAACGDSLGNGRAMVASAPVDRPWIRQSRPAQRSVDGSTREWCFFPVGLCGFPPSPAPSPNPLPRRGEGSRLSSVSALLDRHVALVFGSGVVRAGADDLAVLSLLDYVRAPAGGTRNDEQRREHGGGHAHHVVGAGRVPVEVGEHLLEVPHQLLDALGHLEQGRVAALGAELARDLLDDLVARIRHRVYRMAEADDDFLLLHARADVRLGIVGIAVAGDDL